MPATTEPLARAAYDYAYEALRAAIAAYEDARTARIYAHPCYLEGCIQAEERAARALDEASRLNAAARAAWQASLDPRR